MMRVWGREGFHQRVKRMGDSLAGVVLAAGAGRRLDPLTQERPKALCPVGNRLLVDHALERASAASNDVAVNLHHGGSAIDAHLPASVHRGWERDEALGTAGALAGLRTWVGGRDVLVTNADACFWPAPDLGFFLDTWDRERVRLLVVETSGPSDFGPFRYCGVALMPGRLVSGLRAVPSGLYEVMWGREAEAGRLDLVVHDGPFVDCASPTDYLAANLLISGGRSTVDPEAVVAPGARVERSVLWAGAVVHEGEVLDRAIRTCSRTVLIRSPLPPTGEA